MRTHWELQPGPLSSWSVPYQAGKYSMRADAEGKGNYAKAFATACLWLCFALIASTSMLYK